MSTPQPPKVPAESRNQGPATVRAAPRPFRIRPASRFGILDRMIAIGAVVALIILYLLIKLGVFTVPILSDWLYRGPVPVRVIPAQPLSWQSFQAALVRRVNETGEVKEGTYRLDITEQELTGVLESTAADALREKSWRLSVAQVAVTQDYLQLWLKMEWGWHGKLDVLMDFKPEVDEKGALHFVIQDVQVGDYRLPAAWGEKLGSFIFSRDLGNWEIDLGGKGSIQSVGLQPGIFTVILTP